MRCCSVFCWVGRAVCQICVHGLYSRSIGRVQKGRCTVSFVFWQHINGTRSLHGIFCVLKLSVSPPNRDFQVLIPSYCRNAQHNLKKKKSLLWNQDVPILSPAPSCGEGLWQSPWHCSSQSQGHVTMLHHHPTHWEREPGRISSIHGFGL